MKVGACKEEALIKRDRVDNEGAERRGEEDIDCRRVRRGRGRREELVCDKPSESCRAL